MRKLLVVIDPGHCGAYNRGADGSYWEGKAMWKLASIEKKALESYGIECMLTRKETSDPELWDRGQTAYLNGVNYENVLFMSDHTNAANGKAKYVVGIASEFLPKSKELGKKLVAAITETMKETGAWDNGVITRLSGSGADWYGVIRSSVNGVKSVSAAEKLPVTHSFIFEHGFHDHLQTCQWLNQDANLQKLADAKVKVIAEYFGMDKKEEPKKKYIVYDKVGVYDTLEEAKAAIKENQMIVDENGEICKFEKLEEYTTTAQSGLNIRSGAGTGYGIITCLPYGTTVKSDGESEENGGTWLKVSFDQGGVERTGYAFETYLQKK